jgi:chromosomal replication initiation ATPase DnaA
MTGQQVMARIRERDDGEILGIIRRLAQTHHVTSLELLESREAGASDARFALWNALMESGCWSYKRLGEVFGRDHTTIRAGIAVHRKRIGAAAVPPHKGKRYVPPSEQSL